VVGKKDIHLDSSKARIADSLNASIRFAQLLPGSIEIEIHETRILTLHHPCQRPQCLHSRWHWRTTGSRTVRFHKSGVGPRARRRCGWMLDGEAR